MKKIKLYHKKRGFTLVELMIATAVFSVVLLVAAAGIIAIGRSYYHSLTTTRVQQTVRSIMDDVSASLQFSQADTVSSQLTNMDGTPATIKVRCFGTDRYRYVLGQKITGPVNGTTNIGLYQDTRSSVNSCDTSGGWTGGKELLGDNMRLLQFDVENSNPFDINIKIASGDDDLLELTQCSGLLVNGVCQNPSDDDIATAHCINGIAGNQFCAVDGLETTVTSRVQ